jgi:hypothetical protein
MTARPKRWGIGVTLFGVFLISAGVSADSRLASQLGQLVMFAGILIMLLTPS